MADRTIIPEVLPPERPLSPDLQAMQRIAILLDRAVRIPGTRQGIGLDAALGLIPGLGDVVGAALSAWIVVGALRHRVPGRKVLRMILNVLIDMVGGEIPVLGDLFDVLFEQNIGNVKILLDNRDAARPPRTYKEIAAKVVIVFAAFIAVGLATSILMLWGLFKLAQAIF